MTMFKLNIIVVSIVLVAALGFGFGLVLPGFKDLKAQQNEIDRELDIVQREQQNVGNISDLYASIVSLDEKQSQFKERLPNDRRFSEFLNTVSECLKKNDIVEPRVQPKDEIKLDPTKLPPSLQLARETAILPVSVEFESSFAGVFGFLNDIESLRRIAHIESIDLANDENRPGRIKVTMQLHTYHRQTTPVLTQ